MVDYYKVLQVSKGAGHNEIKAAFRRLAQAYHPDRNQGSKLHEERFKLVLEAYQTLTDDGKKALYDARLQYHLNQILNPSIGITRSESNSTFSGRDRRTTGNKRPNGEKRADYKDLRASRFTYVGRHHVAISMLIIACMIIGAIWVNSIMMRKTAIYYFNQGDYRESLALDSSFGPAWVRLAKYSYSIGKKEQAIGQISRAILLSDTGSLNWKVWRAGWRMEVQDTNKSIHELRKIENELDKEDTLNLFLVEHLLLHKSHLTKAAFFMERFIPTRPKDVEKLRWCQSSYFLQTGNFLKAEQLLTLQINGNSQPYGKLFFLRALARLQLMDTIGAKADMETSAHSGFELASQYLQHFDFHTPTKE